MPPGPPGGHVTLTLLLLVCTCSCLVTAQTANSVNETGGEIIWGELAPDDPYKTTEYTADDGGLDPYYALAVSFVDSSLPEELPVDTAKQILDGNATIIDKWEPLAQDFVGYALCLVIGFLFIIIFPIVGCCFCCCRCCGNCGGKREHMQGPNDKCKRICFGITLTILSLFVVSGAACVFVTSDQFHKNLGGLNTSFSDAVDDFNTFVDNIDSQFRRLGDENFNYLTNVLDNYVGNTSSKVSEDIINDINSAVNLDDRLNEINTLSATALALVSMLEDQVTTLETQRDTAKGELQTIDAAAPCSGCLATEITFLDNMDTTTMRTQITTFKTQVSANVFQKMKDDLDAAITAEVTAATSSIDVVTTMNNIYNDQIKGMLDQLTTLKTNLNKDASTYQERVSDYVEFLKPYDKYRWYAGVALASLLLLMAVMMLVGVLLGTCCSSADDRPTERSGASNCGGICLMASVGLIFIFGALLMLLATLMYMFGALTERYVCQSIDHWDRLERYTKSLDLGTDLTNYTFNLNSDTIAISFSAFMSECENDATLYTALGLKGVVDTALDKVSDFKNDLDDINNIDAGAAAADASGSVNTDAEINDLKDTANSVTTIKTTVTNLKTSLQTQKANAEVQSTGAGAYYDPMIATLTDMENTCDSLKTTADDIVIAATALEGTEIPAAMAKLNDAAFMEDLINQTTHSFVNSIFGYVDSYTSDIRLKMESDVGKCSPFYSITNAILGEAFCHGMIDPLNGFWLALGWSIFFFMPSLIFAVKLAKHYRTMTFETGYASSPEPSPPPPYSIETSKPPPRTSMFPPINGSTNKVAPF